MKVSLIVGVINRSLGQKNRLCLPAEYEAASENLYAILYEKYMSIYSENVLKNKFELSEDDYSTMEILSVDGGRRTIINDKLLNLYNIKKDLLLVGKNDHFDIVSIENLEDYNKEKKNDKILKNNYDIVLVRKED